MPSWNEVRKEVERRLTPQGTPDCDGVRREKYAAVERHSHRPLIVYATDFLNRAKVTACGGDVEIDLSDRDGILEITRGLTDEEADILFYSPGGLPDAADSIVHIIRSKFRHTRFLVPSVAKSAATMIALAGDQLVMERNAELGPIDPQFRFVKADGTAVIAPAQTIIDQFEKAQELIGQDPKKLAAWIPILQQYGPALYQQCQNAIELSKKYVKEWLITGMLKDAGNREQLAQGVVNYLGDHNLFKSHGARVGVEELRSRGLNVVALNDDPALYEAVMSAFFAIQLTFERTGAYKIFENSRGDAMIRVVQLHPVVTQVPPGTFRGPGGGKKKTR